MSDLAESYVTLPEALRTIRKSRGRTFYLHVNQFARCIDQAGAEPDTVIGRDVSSCARVSKKEALRYLEAAYKGTESTHVVRIALNEYSFFIG